MKYFFVCLFTCLQFLTAAAYRIEWGRNVTIYRPVYEDLYIAGGTVNLNAPVYGDLIVAGGTVRINDTVSNDLLVAGGTVYINGFVGDDIRCAGGKLYLMKNIGGDLLVTGGRVDLKKDVLVMGGLVASGGEVTVDGTISQDVRSSAGEFYFNGFAGRNFDCRSEHLELNGRVMGSAVLAAKEIVLGGRAYFGGGVRYWNKRGRLNFGQAVKGGSPVFDPSIAITTNAWYYLGNSTFLGMAWYLSSVFLFIILIQYLFGNTIKAAGTTIEHSLVRSLYQGLLFFIGVPLSIILLLVTIIGIPVGIILMFLYVVLILLATVITSLVVANWYNRRFKRHWGFWQTVFGATALFILFKVVTFTPFFGWIIMLLLACVAFGAIILNINWRRGLNVTVHRPHQPA